MKKKAFTLIELLVVIAIIVLLVSILVPSLKKAKDLADRLVCLTTLRNHGMNIEMYTSENNGVYPYAQMPNGASTGSDQFRYFYNGMKDYYPESTLSGLSDDESYLDYICPVFRKRFPVGAYLSLPGNQWWFQTHLYGYQHAFGYYYNPNSSYAPGIYRALGGLSKSLVGSQSDKTANQVGAIPAGRPERLVMMSDFGFCYNGRVSPLREVGEWTHPDGWGALLGDGRAAFFTTDNYYRHWYDINLLASDVTEY